MADRNRLFRWQVLTLLLMLLGYSGYYLCRSNFSVALPLITDELVARTLSRHRPHSAGTIASQGRSGVRHRQVSADASALSWARLTWNRNLAPHWYPVELIVLALPQSWLGAELFLHSASSNS